MTATNVTAEQTIYLFRSWKHEYQPIKSNFKTSLFDIYRCYNWLGWTAGWFVWNVQKRSDSYTEMSDIRFKFSALKDHSPSQENIVINIEALSGRASRSHDLGRSFGRTPMFQTRTGKYFGLCSVSRKARSYFTIMVVQDTIVLFLDFIGANQSTLGLSQYLGFPLPPVQSD